MAGYADWTELDSKKAQNISYLKIMALMLCVTGANADQPNELDINYNKTSREFVIDVPRDRSFPELQKPVPLRLTNNVHMDPSLLGMTNTQAVAINSQVNQKQTVFERAPCQQGFERNGADYTVCFDAGQTALNKAATEDLQALAKNEGLFEVITYSHGPLSGNEQIAKQRSAAILKLLADAGIEQDWIHSESDYADGCVKNCDNYAIVVYQPFK